MTPLGRRNPRSARLFALALPLLAVGCYGAPSAVDPDALTPLADLADSGQAVVRLYAAGLPLLDDIAQHPWFVVKTKGSNVFERWEVYFEPAPPFGFVRRDAFPVEQPLGGSPTQVIAELIGPEAEPIVAFIRAHARDYPCANFYVLYPGPNSSTFVQWVLDQTGWNVVLPPTIVGELVDPVCP